MNARNQLQRESNVNKSEAGEKEGSVESKGWNRIESEVVRENERN